MKVKYKVLHFIPAPFLKKRELHICSPNTQSSQLTFLLSALNGNVAFLVLDGFFLFLRYTECQDTVFILRMNVIFGNLIAYVEASAHAACVTLTSYIGAVL